MPDDVETRNSLGAALYATGDREAAIAQYRQSPGNQARLCGGPKRPRRGSLREGRKGGGHRAIPPSPGNQARLCGGHSQPGQRLASKGEYEAAIAPIPQALEIKPDYAEARNNLGIALLLKGDLQEAIAQYQKASQLSGGGNAMILRSLAAAYAETGSYGRRRTGPARPELAKGAKERRAGRGVAKGNQLYEANTTARDAPR